MKPLTKAYLMINKFQGYSATTLETGIDVKTRDINAIRISLITVTYIIEELDKANNKVRIDFYRKVEHHLKNILLEIEKTTE